MAEMRLDLEDLARRTIADRTSLEWPQDHQLDS